jgi:Putative DNA-binding domain
MRIQTRADLEQLVRDGVPESLTLDYKRSESLGKESEKRNELCKDVSAFANSAGGRLIYGIPEQDHVPQPLDTGVNKTVITPEWIEQVLNSNAQPRIEGLQITQISADTGDNQVFYVIDVPQATARAPHQAPDRKYYKRFNFMSVPMEDYEIRDVLQRATTPALRLQFRFSDGSEAQLVRFPNTPETGAGPDQRLSDPISIITTIHNDSPQPAEYVLVSIYIHPRLVLQGAAGFTVSQQKLTSPVPRLMSVLNRQFSIPKDMPIFKEAPHQFPGSFGFAVQMRDASHESPIPFPFGYRLRCPGFDTERWGHLRLIDDWVHIEFTD